MAEKVADVISHWYHLIEGLPASSQSFYAAIHLAVDRRNLPNVRLSRITHREGGVFSSKREYLRVRRKELVFDICAAPFGPSGFFVSWWLGEMPTALWAIIPFLGPALARLFRPATYFHRDTALMFQESIHRAVLEILDGATKARGLRALSESDRKPILTGLFFKGGLSRG